MARPPAPSAAHSVRHLGHDQMAFVRAWAEGVDLQQAAGRYLPEGTAGDARLTRTLLQGLLDQLRGVARAHGRGDLAALLRRDPASMVDGAAKAPSLDDFRAQQPEDFYSEAELLALYEATHGAPDARSGARRRQRLRARQLAALQWLEGVAVREPRPADPVASWLDERLAARLSAAGLERLDQLLAWIRHRGFHWHRGIPRVGAAAAARLQHWLRQHARSLGALPAWAQVPPGRLDRAALVGRTAGLAPPVQAGRLSGPPLPLERLALLSLPAELSGRDGRHRAPRQADGTRVLPGDDLAALNAWLARRTPGSATWRAYRKEAERLLLWALWVAGKPLSSLDAADLPAYQAFLAAPPASWRAPRGTPRWHDAWRPFEGPLSARSAAMALGIVRGMLDAWVAQGHLAVNAWAVNSRTVKTRTVKARTLGAPTPLASAPPDDEGRGTGTTVAAASHADAGGPSRPTATAADAAPPIAPNALPAAAALRSLTPAHRAAMAQWMDRCIGAQGHTPALLRLRALWATACCTGLRPAELVGARLGWLVTHRSGGPSMALEVPASATAGAARCLALDAAASEALQRYLASRGLAPQAAQNGVVTGAEAEAGEALPLFAQLRSPAPLSAARFYEVVAQAFSACADDLAPRDAASAATLRRASTLWMRHGFGFELAASGEPAPGLQHRMGHRSRASGAVYRRAARAVSEAGVIG